MSQIVSGGQIITSGSADNMGADVVSQVVHVEGRTSVAFEAFVDNTNSTGTAVGSIAIEVSLTNSNWTPINFYNGATMVASVTVSTGTDLTLFANIERLTAMFARLKYTRTSGDGWLDAWAKSGGRS